MAEYVGLKRTGGPKDVGSSCQPADKLPLLPWSTPPELEAAAPKVTSVRSAKATNVVENLEKVGAPADQGLG